MLDGLMGEWKSNQDLVKGSALGWVWWLGKGGVSILKELNGYYNLFYVGLMGVEGGKLVELVVPLGGGGAG